MDIELEHFDNLKDVVIDYINKQNYDSDDIKNGVIIEMNNITKIYDDKYGNKKVN